MPGVKPQSGQRPSREKQTRKPRPHGFARQRMTPAHRVEHVVDNCPGCGTRLSGGWTQRTREVIRPDAGSGASYRARLYHPGLPSM